MIKDRTKFIYLRLITDFLLLLFFYTATIRVRIYFSYIRPFCVYSFKPYIILFIITIIFFVIYGFIERFFTNIYYQDKSIAFLKSASVINKTFISVIVFAFLFREFSSDFYYSRFILLFFFGLSFIGLSLVRVLFHLKTKDLINRGVIHPPEFLIIGYNNISHKIKSILSRLPSFKFKGYITCEEQQDGEGIIDNLKNYERYLKEDSLTDVVIAQPGIDPFKELRLIVESILYGKRVKIICENFGSDGILLEGLELYELREIKLSRESLLLKRIFDIIFVICSLPLVTTLCLVIAVLIKITSSGPVLYKQKRVGFDGKVFRIFKFRTMYVGAERKTGPVITDWDDTRCTRVGKFLRRFGIDEIPQLWNVFIGDMSLVGPRPERPVFVKQFIEEIPQYIYRHIMKPGLTGWAQINGFRGDTDIKERIKFDLYYLENWSLFFDIKIIVRTIPFLLKKQVI
ncbi:MAG: sugar transferase [Candidatus Hydrogenedentota bacterium]